jgi:hypothetical protein
MEVSKGVKNLLETKDGRRKLDLAIEEAHACCYLARYDLTTVPGR